MQARPVTSRSASVEEAPGATTPVRLTIEAAVSEPTISRFYQLYAAAFGPLTTRAVARQVLRHDEFVEEMADPRIWKYLAWDGPEVVGMTTLTRSMDAIPWISPDYFAHRFPDHWQRNAVYYLGFSLVRPSHQRSHMFRTMIAAVAHRMARERAILAYDICSYNHMTLRLARASELILHRNAEVEVAMLDAQTYYAAEFSGRGPRGEPLCGSETQLGLSDAPFIDAANAANAAGQD